MATPPKANKPSKPTLYLGEWFHKFDLSDQAVADKFGCTRQTVFRWKKGERSLTPARQIQLAQMLGISPSDFWRHPDEISIDALLENAPRDVREQIADVVGAIVKRRPAA